LRSFWIYVELSKPYRPEYFAAKTGKIGIIGKERQWFATYLIGRTQKPKVDGVFSDTIENKLGVAQGPTLGPILFLLYILML
jgi:hypothetical protein